MRKMMTRVSRLCNSPSQALRNNHHKGTSASKHFFFEPKFGFYTNAAGSVFCERSTYVWTNTNLSPIQTRAEARKGARPVHRQTHCELSLFLSFRRHTKNSVRARLGERVPVVAARSRRCGGSGVAVWAALRGAAARRKLEWRMLGRCGCA